MEPHVMVIAALADRDHRASVVGDRDEHTIVPHRGTKAPLEGDSRVFVGRGTTADPEGEFGLLTAIQRCDPVVGIARDATAHGLTSRGSTIRRAIE
jgi:hypothetical protein